MLPVAIVSANAFDRGLDNDVGIAATDFFVKPVRRSDLLDWLGSHLRLQWQTSAIPMPQTKPECRPPESALDTLRASVASGYLRGIREQLDAIDSAHPDATAFVARLRAHAARFEIEALKSLLNEPTHDAA